MSKTFVLNLSRGFLLVRYPASHKKSVQARVLAVLQPYKTCKQNLHLLLIIFINGAATGVRDRKFLIVDIAFVTFEAGSSLSIQITPA